MHESLQRKQEELRGKLEALETPTAVQGASLGDIESRQRELETLNAAIDDLNAKISGGWGFPVITLPDTHIPYSEFDEEGQELGSQINTATEELERLQAMQADDSRGISKHQKSTERYLAKRELLTSRRDACNKNIRDLGVLPEEAFEKYTTVKLERVNFVFLFIVYPIADD